MRLRRRLQPFRLLPLRVVVLGVLVAASIAASHLSTVHVSLPRVFAASSATMQPAPPATSPTVLRTLPPRRAGEAMVLAAQLVAEHPARHNEVGLTPVPGADVHFSWHAAGRPHHRVVGTNPEGWAVLRLTGVHRQLRVRAGFPGTETFEAATTATAVPPPPVSRSAVRRAVRHHHPTRAAVPHALRHYPSSVFVFPFLHPHEAQSPGEWTQDQGVDLAANGFACGSAAVLVAVGNGVVIQEGISGFGPTAPVIRMTSGPFVGRNVYYGHTGRVYVPVGAHVRAGQPIAEVGCGRVGYSSAPHLEIGVGVQGGPSCCPGWHQTSAEMYHWLLRTY